MADGDGVETIKANVLTGGNRSRRFETRRINNGPEGLQNLFVSVCQANQVDHDSQWFIAQTMGRLEEKRVNKARKSIGRSFVLDLVRCCENESCFPFHYQIASMHFMIVISVKLYARYCYVKCLRPQLIMLLSEDFIWRSCHKCKGFVLVQSSVKFHGQD